MAPDDGGRFKFAHQQLDVYGVALKLVVAVRRLMERVPRGHRSIADQGLRASASTVLADRASAMLLRLEQRFGPGA